MIAYFTSQYPKVSHSFIRREIEALEALGHPVRRYALRGWNEDLVEQADLRERARTLFLLQGGILPLLIATLVTAARRPLMFGKALKLSAQMMHRSNRSFALHLASLCEAAALARQMLAENVSHLHAHFGTNSAEVAMLAGAIAGVPFSFTVHGPDEFDAPVMLKLRLKVRHAKFVAAITPFCASQIYRWADVADWPKVSVVRCGLSAAFLNAPVVPHNETNKLVCIARLSPQKGHLLALEAISLLRARGTAVDLTLIGDGEMRPEIEQAIGRLALEDCVTITGWADEDQVRRHLCGARALLLPSFAEGLPVVIMEALALGRPVLASNVGAVSELVINEETGWLFQPGSVEAIAAAIRSCLATPAAERMRMGLNGRQLVREKHDAQVEAARIASLFGLPATAVTHTPLLRRVA